MQRMRRASGYRCAATAVIGVVLCLVGVRSASAQSLLTIALTGDPAPDGDGVLSTLHRPVLNDSGWVAFESRTSGHTNLFYPELLLLGDGTNLIQIARGGFEEPISFRVPALNEINQLASSGYTNILSGQSGLLRADIDRLIFLAQFRAPDPDNVGLYETFGRVSLNDGGWGAFRGGVEIDDFNVRVGVYVSDGTNVTSYAVDGQTLPGTTNTLDSFGDPVALNNAGQVAFLAGLAAEDGGAERGLYLSDGTSVVQLAHNGDAAPGGGIWREFLQPVLNEAGQVAFYARLEGIGAGPRGIYLADTSSVTVVAMEDQPMPDGDGVFAGFTQPVMNDAGQVAFVGFEEGALNRFNGIFLTVNGVLTEVVRANDPAPEGGGSFVFYSSGADYTPVINNRGQLAFRADFATPRNSDEGIVFRDVNGTLRLVARDGQSLAGSTITELGLMGSDWVGLERDFGGRKALNERVQVAFHATLADGREGVFLWTPPGLRIPLRIHLAGLEGNDVVIRVPSIEGFSYQLQRHDTLEPGGWANEGGPVPGTGTEIELRHAGGALLDAQFYLVGETPNP